MTLKNVKINKNFSNIAVIANEEKKKGAISINVDRKSFERYSEKLNLLRKNADRFIKDGNMVMVCTSCSCEVAKCAISKAIPYTHISAYDGSIIINKRGKIEYITEMDKFAVSDLRELLEKYQGNIIAFYYYYKKFRSFEFDKNESILGVEMTLDTELFRSKGFSKDFDRIMKSHPELIQRRSEKFNETIVAIKPKHDKKRYNEFKRNNSLDKNDKVELMEPKRLVRFLRRVK